MDIIVTLEKKQKLMADENLYQELETKVQFDALKKRGKLPSLTELLYNQTEDEILSIKEMLGLETD